MDDDVRDKPSARGFAPPVAWLLGPELVGAVRTFAMYALFKGQFDARDWMTPTVHREAPEGPDPDELWFDYIADVGDGQRAAYTSALVLQDDVLVEGPLDALIAARQGAATTPLAAAAAPPGWAHAATLPRGQFLLLGGDTAYPLADVVNLNAHLREPLVWAYRDLRAAGRLGGAGPAAPRRAIYGVPGNHDYYDALVGFNRFFRRPVISEDVPGPRGRRPMLGLPGFERRQGASYFALELPWGWQLWGLDTLMGLDYRQECFFRERPRADKLILLTPSPSISFGRVVATRDAVETLVNLELPAPFLSLAPSSLLVDGKPAPAAASPTLPAGQCRLDLSGDMHYYARFDGQVPSADRCGGATCYAAVVSGAGGAFHHPSFTDLGEVPAAAVYPPPDASRRAVARRLFHPETLLQGGVIIVPAAALAVVVTWGSLRADTRAMFDWFWRLLGIHHEAGLAGDLGPLPVERWHDLLATGAFMVALMASLVCLAWAKRYAGWVTRNLREPPHRWAVALRLMRRVPFGRTFEEGGYLPSWALIGVALVLPMIVPSIVHPFPAAGVLVFHVGFYVTVAVVPLSLILFGYWTGAEYQRPKERLRFGLFGAIHAVIQLTMPVGLVRLGLRSPVGLGVAVLLSLATTLIGQRVLEREGRRWRLAGLAMWLSRWLVMIIFLAGTADGAVGAPSTTASLALVLVAAAVVGALVGCVELGWYLAVTAAWNGHNNEAGAACRIEDFRQFVRFRLTAETLTGFVIAIDRATTEAAEVAPRIIDVFEIRRPGVVESSDPATPPAPGG